ncbi:hypothetical protein [Streptomyces caeruleatus]|uniref:hypothetical protein n=1 Tax=Streptomyces caeruleatus TaxID=661399 RepID=UPI00099EFBDF|nr:hypothetical protein [Streptomyces caeruleatus]
MFRLLYDAVARLLGRPAVRERDLAREVRAPDPYVPRLPNPHDARWRRWARRNRAAGRYLAFLPEEACWQLPPRHPGPPLWRGGDDPVRLYVLHSAVEGST